jgi:hypothetical protein
MVGVQRPTLIKRLSAKRDGDGLHEFIDGDRAKELVADGNWTVP